MNPQQVEQVLTKLNELRQDRHNEIFLKNITNDSDNIVLDNIIADAINALEMLFIILNVHPEGDAGTFIPITKID